MRSRLPLRATLTLRRRLIRLQSTTSSPSSKITSLPFRIPPQDALNKLHIAALVSTLRLSNLIFAGLLRFFGPGITAFAKEFGLGESLKLKDMRAALYPVWRCDVLLEGKVRNEYSKEKRETRGVVGVEGGYVPGNPFAPLSYISYATQAIPDDLAAYDPSTDLIQLGDGYDVVPIPFTVSPLGLLEQVRSTIGKRKGWQGLVLEEAKWQEVMVACYPIMFPIYIADFQYEKAEKETRSVTVVLDAHEDSSTSRVSTPTPPELFERGNLSKNYYVNPHAFMPIAHFLLPMALADPPPPLPTSTSDGEVRLPPGADKLIEAYQYFMSPAPISLSSIPPSPMVEVQQAEGGVDWDDPRLQSWSGDTRRGNEAWIKRAIGIETHLGFIRSLEGKTEEEGAMVKTFEIHLDRQPHVETTMKPMSEMREEAERDGARLRKELEQSKPEWLKHFQEDVSRTSGQDQGRPTKKAR